MKLRTSEMKERALDWAVTKCEGFDHAVTPGNEWGLWGWATDWAQGGPLIEREGIDLYHQRQSDLSVAWVATGDSGESEHIAPTPLIAAMRCYVASVLGDEVDVPEELQ
jgi:hypothetical protein